jgi:hypothetical protein
MYPKQAAPNMASTTIRAHMSPLVAGHKDMHSQKEGRSPPPPILIIFLSPIPPLPKYRIKPRHLLPRYPYAHEHAGNMGGMCRLLLGDVIVATILLIPWVATIGG